jgi:hypothetical protein
VFCRRDVPLTAEHVFPKWTQPYLLDAEGELGTHTRVTIRAGQGATDERSHRGRPATATVRSVCGDCNNGWMSRIEQEAKPRLLAMLRDKSMFAGTQMHFDERDRLVLARWLVKTALVVGS